MVDGATPYSDSDKRIDLHSWDEAAVAADVLLELGVEPAALWPYVPLFTLPKTTSISIEGRPTEYTTRTLIVTETRIGWTSVRMGTRRIKRGAIWGPCVRKRARNRKPWIISSNN